MSDTMIHESPVIKKMVAETIHDQETLKNALLSRIPEEYQTTFFSPKEPQNLTVEEHGLSLSNLTAATARVQRAIENQEKVLIFGDYDCDGVTATAVLWETLNELGLKTRPFLPHRERHGYGLSVKALEEIWQEFIPDLVITVDNGIVAHEAFSWLKEKGVDTILSDHHSSDGVFPPADIVLHSTKLAGVTVSWMLAHSLAPEIAQTKLDYAVLGTFADQVPLYGANRSFAVHGLTALRNTSRKSLLSLAEAAGCELSQASAETVHYSLAPRINAMGRLGDAMDALRALVSQNPTRIRESIALLHDTNTSRQELTKDMYEEVLANLDISQEHLVIVSGAYHEGVVGLLASKLVDATQRPSIAFSTNGLIAKASVRSVPGVNIIDFLRAQKDIPYLALGGHAMAAGFSVPLDTLDEVVSQLRTAAIKAISAELLIPKISAVGSIDWSLLSADTLRTLHDFSPFGAGNEAPLFVLEGAKIADFRAVGKNGAHWQLSLINEISGYKAHAIYFHAAEKMQKPLSEYHQVVVKLSPSKYRGRAVDIVVEAVL